MLPIATDALQPVLVGDVALAVDVGLDQQFLETVEDPAQVLDHGHDFEQELRDKLEHQHLHELLGRDLVQLPVIRIVGERLVALD